MVRDPNYDWAAFLWENFWSSDDPSDEEDPMDPDVRDNPEDPEED